MTSPPLTCLRALAVACAIGPALTTTAAQEGATGFLCCNLRSDGTWISDSNYAERGKFVVPVGTPVRTLGFGRWRVHLELEGGQRMALGNDYSRDRAMEEFQRKYVLPEDPRKTLAALPAKTRAAIENARVSIGMTRGEVAMALGWPITSENPRLDAGVWRFWLSSFTPFQVYFDDTGRVRLVEGDAETLSKVFQTQ